MTTLTENFTGGQEIGWTQTGSHTPTLTSNEAQHSGFGQVSQITNDSLSTGDHYAEAMIAVNNIASPDESYCGVWVRATSTFLTGYMGFIFDDAGTLIAAIDKYVGGAWSAGWGPGTITQSGWDQSTANAGHLVSLQATQEGSNVRLKMFVDSTEVLNVVDSTSPISNTQRKVGYFMDAGGSITWHLDSFTAEDIVAGTNVAVSTVAASATVRSVTIQLGGTPTPARVAATASVPTVGIQSGSGGGPVNTIVGTPARNMLAYGGSWLYYDNSELTTLKNRGWAGGDTGLGFIYDLGGEHNFHATNGNQAGAEYYAMRAMEGNEPDTGVAFTRPVDLMHPLGMLHGVGWYLMSPTNYPSPPNDGPPLGDWWSDTLKNTLVNFFDRFGAHAVRAGTDFVIFDNELNSNGWKADGYTGDTHTEAQNRQRIFDFGKALGSALYARKPALHTAMYSWYMDYGFSAEVQEHVNSLPLETTFPSYGITDFWCGWLDAMRVNNATGKVYVLDAQMYRHPANSYGSGGTYAGAYRLDTERAMARLSQYCTPGHALARPWASDALLTYVMQTLLPCAFTWRGTDTAGYYMSTQPDDTLWCEMRDEARKRSRGAYMWEYTLNTGSPGGPGPFGTPWTGSTLIACAAAAAATTPISTTYPTITNKNVTDNGGGSFTVTCRAAHAYGVPCVEVWRGPTRLKTMTMTWNANGGTMATGYPDAYQECSATLTGRSASDIITFVAYSNRDDIGTSTMQLGTGTPPVDVPALVVGAGATVQNVGITATGRPSPNVVAATATVRGPIIITSTPQPTPNSVAATATVRTVSITTPTVYDPANLAVNVSGSVATLTWSASTTPGVTSYSIFRRSPQTGQPFNPLVDTPLVENISVLTYDDHVSVTGNYDWQVFGKIP